MRRAWHRHGPYRAAALPSLKPAPPIDWQRYKALCDRPDVLSRWMLTETSALLCGTLRAALIAATTGSPLPKPPGHKGGPDTDMFEIQLPRTDIAAVLAVVEDAARHGRRTPRGGKLGGFVVAWRELDDYRAAPGV